MTFAHVTNGVVDSLGTPPDTTFAEGRWWDLRDGDPQTLAAAGWLPVTPVLPPADTATTTYDYSVVLVAGVPTEQWAARAKSPDELARDVRNAARAALRTDTTGDLVALRAAIDSLAVLLGDTATPGSIRAIMGSTTDVAGTTSLRALGKQTNTVVVSAASIKALIDHVINLAQLSVNDAQATRKIARETLRLAKDLVGDYTSADVGAA